MLTNPAERDYFWMAKAIQLARRGLYTTSPNPRVGCVIVDSTNTLIGEGAHLQAGTAHAEVHALQQTGQRAAGATAYVTLEPCSHFGRTPPCADALVKAGVQRVVVAMTDPNPAVSGRGIQRLKDAGIDVVTGVMTREAAALNPGFIKRMTTGKPLVTVKMGISLDGKIALSNGVSQWITGPEARRDVQRLRARSCAVLTGAGTVRHDNPSLLVRPEQAMFSEYPLDIIRQPARVVVEGVSPLPDARQCFDDGFKTYLVTTDASRTAGDATPLVVAARDGRPDITALVQKLGDLQFNEVLVEAGPGLAGALLAAGEVDELICYQAPKVLGDKAQSMLILPDYRTLDEAPLLTLKDTRRLGQDIRLHYTVASPA
ncbi:bifunctional diaminohydroxyphosphoribosylaminopyrimidine deaminase/5-amino-6-(5-phosphoribosylamino)uracil reductase RibD [Alteromonas sp. CYL-A6]|uniref:bifunctional diaminohydroxyphosphoribosylaminopyrimidine deaminase/5-amino-6-(5-phosphoribosylamino)uracil reductase RibD n=1 Tax=Alteromonas nitratireducens TaxID=3390813 RepID=UPI0034BCFFA2